MTWLEAESSRWVTEGLVDEAARIRILATYDAGTAPHRGMMALVLMAVLMCGLGVLLVIGYNWQRISPAVKIAMVLASVAMAFGGSAMAYARRHHTLGEVLAFAGTLLFGNGIWLIAQVLHIQGHYPDAFLWFALGALSCAWLVRSKAAGIGAGVLAAAWIATEATFFPHPVYRFLGLWPAALWVAYQLRSPVMLRILALTAALWVLVSTASSTHGIELSGAAALAGSALYAASRWHDGPLSGAWRTSGLVVLLLAFIPMMAGDWNSHIARDVGAVTAAITIAVAAAALTIALRLSDAVDWSVLTIGAVTAAWTAALWLNLFADAAWPMTAGKVMFTGLALVMAVSLIRTAFGSNRTSDLVFGVLFGLAVLLVRWASVLGNLLWSGLFLLLAGGGLLLVARSWLRRDRNAIAGRAA
jgi:hypothetical protein